MEEDRAVSVAERTSKAKAWAANSFECSVRDGRVVLLACVGLLACVVVGRVCWKRSGAFSVLREALSVAVSARVFMRAWVVYFLACLLQSKSGLNVKLIFDQLISAILSTSTDPTKGGGGGGVMGAGLKPANVVVPEPKKKSGCAIL